MRPNRIEDHFLDQMQMPISAGSVFNFNQEAYVRLEFFDQWVRTQLTSSSLIRGDETGINIDGKRNWLQNASNDKFTYFYPHSKRGCEALNDVGIITIFRGVLCHDHWKPYYQYGVSHALCNAHHLRELEQSWEQDKQQWAKKMAELL
jgi:transposase